MTISVSLSGNQLSLKILNGPDWNADLAAIKALPDRNYNGDLKTWQVPWYLAPDVVRQIPTAIITSDIQGILSEVRPLNKISELAPIIYPLEFSKPPLSYQERYIRISPTKRRTLLAMEQGTGKTFSSLERARVLGYKRLLIVCPKVVCANWRTEIRAVLGETAIIYQGTKSKREKHRAQVLSDYRAPVICTYETVGEITEMLQQTVFDHVIFDEAHLFSNPESKRFAQVVALRDRVPRAAIQCLTGTPMQHRIRDLWAILHVLEPLWAGAYQAFRDRYELPVRWMDKRIKTSAGWRLMRVPIKWKPQNLDELREKLECISFRVRREDVTSFRDSMEMVTVELTPKQRRMYDLLRKKILVELDNREISLRHVPVRLLRLLQAAEGCFNFEDTNWESGKLEYVKDVLDNTDQKVIVWSRFKPITEILGWIYKGKAVIYNGDKSDNYKQLAKWAFNGVDNEEDRAEYYRLRSRLKEEFPFEPGEAQFFFGTIDMRSSLGMNLHRDCWMQIFTSFSWMGAANAQAADRLRRIGQESEVVRTLFLVAEDTFEAQALSLIMRNFSNTVRALDGTERMSFRNIQDIIELLRDVSISIS